ncbi:MAG: SLC13 family permease [Owenweeksia sp.]
MGYEAYVTIAVVVIAFVLFATEYFTVDHIALSIIGVLVVSGVLTPEEGVGGFANTATITVAAMFILSNCLIQTGIVEGIAPLMTRLMRAGYHTALLGIMSVVGSISAFINNTPVVATFIPIISNASQKTKTPSSKYLIPLSFGAILGGTCTLIGTSTNLLVSGIAADNGLKPFSMFLMAPLGLIFFIAGITYMLVVGKKLTPSNKEVRDLRNEAEIKNYTTEIRVTTERNAQDEELTIRNIFKKDGSEVVVLQVFRENRIYKSPTKEFELRKDDILLVQGDMDKMKSILQNEALSLTEALSDKHFPEEETTLVEIVILPNSELSEKSLNSKEFFQKYNSKVLAIRQRGKQRFENLDRIFLRAGDILLLQTNEKGYQMLSNVMGSWQTPFLSMRETGLKKVQKGRLALVGATIALAIILATLDIIPIMVGAICAIAILLFFKVTTMSEAYKSIDWKVIILLAGALSLGEAMNKSGVSQQIADLLIHNIGSHFGPIAVISALYLTTSLLTEIMSNNAAAALLAPIAISIAATMGVDAVPFLLSIAFAGSASFMTPIGYQTNTMVYSAGNYKFRDFTRIGTPLNILLWIMATFLIPVFYPL